jgi:hypothetical protein
MQGVRRLSEAKSQSCESEQGIKRLLLQLCAESKEFKHLEVSEGCRKECVQEFCLRLRVIRKLRKDKAFELVEGQCREAVAGSS